MKRALLLLSMYSPLMLLAQISVEGTLKGDDHEKLAGAHIIIQDTYKGSVSAYDGSFLLTGLNKQAYNIVFSYIGYEDTTITVDLASFEGDQFQLEHPVIMQRRAVMSDEVIVTATRASNKTPMTFSTVEKEEIEAQYFGQDMPYLLEQTPSVVVTSDAGTGIGYTGMRLRGTDPTRINVTLNGVPLNDPESQGVFWVDMADFASSTENIQVQRGVGTSTNGSGAFGGSINVKTDNVQQKPYAEVGLTAGSFNTQRYSIKLGSGLINNKFVFDGRLSSITSDGYIDRATADLKSYYLSGAYVGKNSLLKFITFSGKEVTYQAWGGVPSDSLETNRTFNPYTYDNEVDDYAQTHYQLHFDQSIGRVFDLSITAFRTEGNGYFEQYKEDQYMPDYGMDPVINGSDTTEYTDLIRRRWLDNDFTGANLAFNYNHGKTNATLGASQSFYHGKHYGEVIWARTASNTEIRHRYYDNDADKSDINTFLKVEREVSKGVSVYGDLQLRRVSYQFIGLNEGGLADRQDVDFTFFNPKAGVMWDPNPTNRFYYSFAVANKEPNRNDFVESTPNSRPKQEQLLDHELGYRYRAEKFYVSGNLYYMSYNDQLVLTGELNDVGAATRTNVDKSHRAGIEIEGAVTIIKKITWRANATFSQNKIKDFVEYVDNWDTGGQERIEHGETDLALSPSFIAASDLSYQLCKKEHRSFTVSLLSKYVGEQFVDNTSSQDRKINAYFINDLRFNWDLSPNGIRGINVMLTVRNLFDVQYESNAWVYCYYTDGEFGKINGYYPQAGGNFMASLNFRF